MSDSTAASTTSAPTPAPEGWIIIWPGQPCQHGNCPTVYVDDAASGSVIVQGYDLDEATAATLGTLPTGESALRIPRELIIGAYEQLRSKGQV